MTKYKHLSIGSLFASWVVAASSVTASTEESIFLRRTQTVDKSTVADFTITCQTDRIVFVQNQATSIDRTCTISSFGLFTKNIELSCGGSLAGVDCNVSPSSIAITHDTDTFNKDVTVTIETTGVVATQDGKMLITASYDEDERSTHIPVLISSDHQSTERELRQDLTSMETEDGVDYTRGSLTDFFLLSGQSNMVGHTTSGQSLGKDESYWLRLKSILDAGGDPAVMENDMFTVIREEQLARKTNAPESVDITLANETMKLYNKGLLNDLDTPLNLGR